MTEKSLHADLAEVMAEVGYVQKDGTNAFQKYKYASAEAVLKKVNAALSSRGICISSNCTVVHFNPSGTDSSGGKVASNAVVHLRLKFVRGSEEVLVEGMGQGADSGDKAVMKANTAAIKYCLTNAFCISWGDDPEADETTDGAPKKGRAATKKTAPTLDNKALLAQIDGAGSRKALEAVKEDIKKFSRTSPEYKALVAAFQKKKETFGNE